MKWVLHKQYFLQGSQVLEVIFLCTNSGFGSANVRSLVTRRNLMSGVNGKWLERIQSRPLTFQVSKVILILHVYSCVTLCSESLACFLRNRGNFSEVRVFILVLQKIWSIYFGLAGQPLNVSAAYSGRIACAYKYGKSFTRPSKRDPESRYVNLCVAIYECESTGGKKS